MNKRQFIKSAIVGTGAFLGLSSIIKAFNTRTMDTSVNTGGLWKWSTEGKYYTQTARGPVCELCPNNCVIKLNDLSPCRNRINFNNKIYSIAYGNPCAVHADPIEKKPLFHFLPSSRSYSIAAAGCNLSCLNCQNWEISQVSPHKTRNIDLMPEKVVEECIKNNCSSISYTYSEPITFYEYTYDSSKIARSKGIKNVLVSAGYINEIPLRNLCKVIDAANIDLKSFSDEIYLKLNGGRLKHVLNTLKVMKEEGVWLEITNLVVPQWTDDMDMIKKMCEWLTQNGMAENPIHFSRFHPMYKLSQLSATPIATLRKARETALAEGMKFVYIGNVPDEDGENTYCPKCKKLLVNRKGYIISENNIENSSCKFCKTKISGMWE